MLYESFKYSLQTHLGTFNQNSKHKVAHFDILHFLVFIIRVRGFEGLLALVGDPYELLLEFTELFVKGKEDIKEQKLKVSYSQPAPPPSPVPEGEEGPSEDATKAKSMFTAAETAPVSNDVGSLQRELERFRAKNESLSKGLDMALQGGKRERSTGFNLFHLLLVAIVAFLVGHYS